jgi:hypothetical protein
METPPHAPYPELCPVVETPWYEGQPPWLWPVAARELFSFMPLSGDMSNEDVGLFFGQLVNYNNIEGDDIEALQRCLLDAADIVLPGGVLIRCGDREIDPACCCGLEDWREWEQFLRGGVSPWLGHDPFPWVERAGDVVRVWSDGGDEPAPQAFAIEFEHARFAAELRRVETVLQAFAERVGRWAADIGFSDPGAIRRKIERRFIACLEDD